MKMESGPMQKFSVVTIVSTLMISAAYLLPSSVQAAFNGLPAHPIMIHGVVALLPLFAFFLQVRLFWKNLLKKLHIPIIGVLIFSVIAALAAKSSGYS